MENLNAISERIVAIKARLGVLKNESQSESDTTDQQDKEKDDSGQCENRGRVIFNASVGPQDIAYPTDLDLLSDAREKTKELIDKLYNPSLHDKKPRTYRRVARRRYLLTAKKKVKSKNEIRRAVGSQLRFVKRNLNPINKLLDTYEVFPLKHKDQKYVQVINTLYDQQKQMHKTKVHKIEQNTSESWIASIILVLNLVKLAGVALHCIIWKWMVSFSARRLFEFFNRFSAG